MVFISLRKTEATEIWDWTELRSSGACYCSTKIWTDTSVLSVCPPWKLVRKSPESKRYFFSITGIVAYFQY